MKISAAPAPGSAAGTACTRRLARISTKPAVRQLLARCQTEPHHSAGRPSRLHLQPGCERRETAQCDPRARTTAQKNQFPAEIQAWRIQRPARLEKGD